MATGSWLAPGTWWGDDESALELELMIVRAVERLVDRAARR